MRLTFDLQTEVRGQQSLIFVLRLNVCNMTFSVLSSFGDLRNSLHYTVLICDLFIMLDLSQSTVCSRHYMILLCICTGGQPVMHTQTLCHSIYPHYGPYEPW